MDKVQLHRSICLFVLSSIHYHSQIRIVEIRVSNNWDISRLQGF